MEKIIWCTQTVTLAGWKKPRYHPGRLQLYARPYGIASAHTVYRRKHIRMEDHRLIHWDTSHSWWIGSSSAHYPQSNGRAELAVKTAKRTLIDYTDRYGHLRHDLAARAMITHRNTPHQVFGLSAAEMLNGRVIRDHLPIFPEKYQIHKRWREIKSITTYTATHSENFRLANRYKSRPKRRWMKTGRVVETMGNKQ